MNFAVQACAVHTKKGGSPTATVPNTGGIRKEFLEAAFVHLSGRHQTNTVPGQEWHLQDVMGCLWAAGMAVRVF
jgi:hypothetical protein